jgi:hypothetical protein
MPVSSTWGKDVAAGWLLKILANNPVSTVFDVGAGEGTWAKLLRPNMPAGARIEAAEIWGPYTIEYGYERLYDAFCIADARALNPLYYSAEIVIFGDVLEHMPKADAREVLSTACFYANNILICNPVLHIGFEGPNGNPYDGHKVQNLWTRDEMDDLVQRMAVEHGFPFTTSYVGPVVGYWLLSQFDMEGAGSEETKVPAGHTGFNVQ